MRSDSTEGLGFFDYEYVQVVQDHGGLLMDLDGEVEGAGMCGAF